MKANRTYKRRELAQLYFPTLTPKSASHKLCSWLTINPQLKRLGNMSRRSFSPAEVALIFAVLGEPDDP